jgi:hypothetical protein
MLKTYSVNSWLKYAKSSKPGVQQDKQRRLRNLRVKRLHSDRERLNPYHLFHP